MNNVQEINVINTSDEIDVMYWSEKFGISPGELHEAVNVMGSNIERVEEYLDKR